LNYFFLHFVEDTQQTQSNKMPKSTKPKLIIVNNDGVCCEKCSKLVPEKYYLGQNKKDDELWIECIHNGWYCPNHSPTSNCGDDDCGCCNAGYDQEAEDELCVFIKAWEREMEQRKLQKELGMKTDGWIQFGDWYDGLTPAVKRCISGKW